MDPGEDWTTYVDLAPPDLLQRLSEVTQALAQLHIEYGQVRAQEKRAKVDGYNRSGETSVTGRQYAADTNAVTITETVFSLEAQIKECQEEQGLLKMILERR